LRDHPQRSPAPQNSGDPMQLFRQQMALIDIVGKSRDPAYHAEQKKKLLAAEQEKLQKAQPHLPVTKATASAPIFNTVSPQQDDNFIRAIIDQDMTGYAGSRLRIRLLDDLTAGHYPIRQGTYLYALISGFSGQRVLLTVQSIMQGGHILPVKLELYDNDGITGLYVPSSAFRDFTKDFGGGANQGMTLQQQADNDNQLVMSVVQKMFESTTTAVSKLIRQNKAKLKYNTLVYLIAPETLKHQ
jgi:conjugative transposon TraM protein